MTRTLRATFDDHQVIVWQAHRAEIAAHAVATGRLGGPGWRLDRVSRFRLSLPSVLARSEWGQRPGREHILAVALSRAGFDALMNQAVLAAFETPIYPTRMAWALATRYANVTVDWHPDVDYSGREQAWQIARISVRDRALRTFTDSVVGVEDWSPRLADPDRLALSPAIEYPLSAEQRRLLAAEV